MKLSGFLFSIAVVGSATTVMTTHGFVTPTTSPRTVSLQVVVLHAKQPGFDSWDFTNNNPSGNPYPGRYYNPAQNIDATKDQQNGQRLARQNNMSNNLNANNPSGSPNPGYYNPPQMLQQQAQGRQQQQQQQNYNSGFQQQSQNHRSKPTDNLSGNPAPGYYNPPQMLQHQNQPYYQGQAQGQMQMQPPPQIPQVLQQQPQARAQAQGQRQMQQQQNYGYGQQPQNTVNYRQSDSISGVPAQQYYSPPQAQMGHRQGGPTGFNTGNNPIYNKPRPSAGFNTGNNPGYNKVWHQQRHEGVRADELDVSNVRSTIFAAQGPNTYNTASVDRTVYRNTVNPTVENVGLTGNVRSAIIDAPGSNRFSTASVERTPYQNTINPTDENVGITGNVRSAIIDAQPRGWDRQSQNNYYPPSASYGYDQYNNGVGGPNGWNQQQQQQGYPNNNPGQNNMGQQPNGGWNQQQQQASYGQSNNGGTTGYPNQYNNQQQPMDYQQRLVNDPQAPYNPGTNYNAPPASPASYTR